MNLKNSWDSTFKLSLLLQSVIFNAPNTKLVKVVGGFSPAGFRPLNGVMFNHPPTLHFPRGCRFHDYVCVATRGSAIAVLQHDVLAGNKDFLTAAQKLHRH